MLKILYIVISFLMTSALFSQDDWESVDYLRKKTNASNYIGHAEPIGEKALEIGFKYSYLDSLSMYDVTGQELSFLDNSYFRRQEADLYFGYGAGPSFDLYANLKYRQNEYGRTAEEISRLPGDAVFTSQGLESYLVGLKYAFLPYKKLRYALSLEFKNTFYSNKRYATSVYQKDTLVLGDDGKEVTIAPSLTYLFSQKNILSARVGYKVMPDHLSDEVVYNLELAHKFNKITPYLGVLGIYSADGDEYTLNPAQKPLMYSGSMMYNSINRSMVAPYVGANFKVSNLKFGLKYLQVASGTSIDKYQELSFECIWQKEKVSVLEKKLSKFKEYDVEGIIIQVSPRGKFVKIDKGLSDTVEKGMRIDFFKSGYFGENQLIASGVVYQSAPDFAIVKILEKYSETSLAEGMVARGY